MDSNEREAQEAVGLTKIFRVTVNVPIETIGSFDQEVIAVDANDARQQIRTMLKIKSDRQIARDIMGSGNQSMNGGLYGGLYNNIKITAPVDDFGITGVYNISPKMPVGESDDKESSISVAGSASGLTHITIDRGGMSENN